MHKTFICSYLSPAIDVGILIHVDDLVVPQQLIELDEGLPDLLLLSSVLLDQVLIQLNIATIKNLLPKETPSLKKTFEAL